MRSTHLLLCGVSVVAALASAGYAPALVADDYDYCLANAGPPPNTPVLAGPENDIITPYQRSGPEYGDFQGEFVVDLDCTVNPELLAEEYGAKVAFSYANLGKNLHLFATPQGSVTDPEAWAETLRADERVLDAYPVYQARMGTGFVPDASDRQIDEQDLQKLENDGRILQEDLRSKEKHPLSSAFCGPLESRFIPAGKKLDFAPHLSSRHLDRDGDGFSDVRSAPAPLQLAKVCEEQLRRNEEVEQALKAFGVTLVLPEPSVCALQRRLCNLSVGKAARTDR